MGTGDYADVPYCCKSASRECRETPREEAAPVNPATQKEVNMSIENYQPGLFTSTYDN